MQKKFAFIPLIALLAVGGCATTETSETASGKRDYSEVLYLRGQFNWWDIAPEYKVKKVGEDLYRTEVELKADGQPYGFKFGNATWSAGTNCGYLSEEFKEIKLGEPAKANCSAVFEDFMFTPPETGTYAFFFDNSGETPVVLVKPAE